MSKALKALLALLLPLAMLAACGDDDDSNGSDDESADFLSEDDAGDDATGDDGTGVDDGVSGDDLDVDDGTGVDDGTDGDDGADGDDGTVGTGTGPVDPATNFHAEAAALCEDFEALAAQEVMAFADENPEITEAEGPGDVPPQVMAEFASLLTGLLNGFVAELRGLSPDGQDAEWQTALDGFDAVVQQIEADPVNALDDDDLFNHIDDRFADFGLDGCL